MSQNSLILPTTGTVSGLQQTQNINAAIDTLNTLSSGATAPASPAAGQLWHDTGNNILKIRDQLNTTWIVLGNIDETNKVFTPNLANILSLNGGSIGGFHNYIINGDMSVAQRATSSTALGYQTVDRWFLNLGAGTQTVSQYKYDSGASFYNDLGSYILISGSSVVGGVLQQSIESVSTLSGQNVTLSYYFEPQSGTDTGGQPYLQQYFGTGGSPSTPVTVNPITDNTTVVAGGYSRRVLTFAVPTISGKTLGTNNDHALIAVIPYAGTFSKTYFNVQLEPGTTASLFERRSPAVELQMCKRYYESGNYIWRGGIANGVSCGGTQIFSVQKRTSPTMVLASNTAIGFPAIPSTISSSTPLYFDISRTANTAGPGGAFADTWTASSEL